MHPLFKHFIAICIVALIFVGIHYVVTNTDVAYVRAPRAEKVEEWATTIDTEVLSNLRQLESVQFNTAVFKTEAYMSLKDIRVKLDTPEFKRGDPFAPSEERRGN